jgi:hypothetical protein
MSKTGMWSISSIFSEDELQKMAYHLNFIARKFKMSISNTKTKSMVMCGNNIQRVKMVIDDNIIEQVTEFKYST